MKKVKIIFLDIDGVLSLPPSKYKTLDEGCCKFLKEIVDQTEAKIVISSAWRHDRMSKVKKSLSRFIPKDCIIGQTPDLTFETHAGRGAEIQKWLDTTSLKDEIESIVIIDDDVFDLTEFAGKIVETETDTGLTMDLAQKAIYILNGE